MPWHIEDPTPSARMLGLLLAMRVTTIASEGRGIDRTDDPSLDDRRAACQGAYIRGEAWKDGLETWRRYAVGGP